MSNSMKALVKRTSFGAAIEDVPIPVCGPDDILVEVLSTAICGSDVHRYFWDSSLGQPDFKVPIIMGHELSGKIIEIGANVERFKLGQEIVAETHIPCGTCYQCETGNQHICNNLKVFSVQVDGCFAKYFALPALCARPLPKNITAKYGPLMEPLGVAYHALSKSNVNGDTVAVIGCGPIGLMAVQVARAMGAGRIIALSRSKEKLDLANQFGADTTLNTSLVKASGEVLKITEGLGVGTVIELSGAYSAFTDGLEMVRKGGTFVAAGIPQKPFEINVAKHIVRRELTIHGMHGREMFKTWHAMTSLVEKGLVNLEPLVTDEFPLTDYEKAFNLVKSGNAIKVLLIP